MAGKKHMSSAEMAESIKKNLATLNYVRACGTMSCGATSDKYRLYEGYCEACWSKIEDYAAIELEMAVDLEVNGPPTAAEWS